MKEMIRRGCGGGNVKEVGWRRCEGGMLGRGRGGGIIETDNIKKP